MNIGSRQSVISTFKYDFSPLNLIISVDLKVYLS